MRTDVALLHPPSIFNFRTRDLRTGPISDVVPSTPVFEMYPIGFISLLNYLVERGYNARISNIAVLMLDSPKFDVDAYIRDFDSDLYGVDLHWLPHVHGAINLARTIKKHHPESKVVMGGFSASYFAEDIMQSHPEVDFILKGDLQERPLQQLVDFVQGKGNPENINNLYYRENGAVKGNGALSDPEAISDVFLNYRTLIKNALKYRDIKGHMPYLSWIKNPMAMTLIQHGCTLNCAFCGGSYYSYSRNFCSKSPLVRSVERVVDEIEIVHRYLGAPIFVAGDLNLVGEKYYMSFLKDVKERGIDIPLLTEYFIPPGEAYYRELRKAFPEFTSEISPESSIEKVRRAAGKAYTNQQLENSMHYAMKNGCKKFDVYFSIGIPTQGVEGVSADVEYSDRLIKMFKGSTMKVSAFISPIAPFLDPGSLLYEFADRYGYRIRTKSLQGYYDLLDFGSGWEDFLNYETDRMDRETIEKATYSAAVNMADVRYRNGQISLSEHNNIVSNVRNYIQGIPVQEEGRSDQHLTYMSKEIEWSRKHHLTMFSFMLFMYRNFYALTKMRIFGDARRRSA